jgi:hypothetical protein
LRRRDITAATFCDFYPWTLIVSLETPRSIQIQTSSPFRRASLEDPPPIPSLTSPIGRRRPIDATKDLLGAFAWASNSPLSSQQTNKPDNQAQVRLRPPSPCPINTQLLESIARRAIHADTPTHSRLQRCDSRSRCRTARPSQQDSKSGQRGDVKLDALP